MRPYDSSQDLNRYVTPLVKVEFEGPDVHEEDLYALMRVRRPLLPSLVR